MSGIDDYRMLPTQREKALRKARSLIEIQTITKRLEDFLESGLPFGAKLKKNPIAEFVKKSLPGT